MDDRITIRVRLVTESKSHSVVFVKSETAVSCECLCRTARARRICPHIEAAVSGDRAQLGSATDAALAQQVRQWIRNDMMRHILNGEAASPTTLHKLVELTRTIKMKFPRISIDMRNDSGDNPEAPIGIGSPIAEAPSLPTGLTDRVSGGSAGKP